MLDEPNKLASAATELKDQDFPFKQIWSYGSIFLELINENSDKGASVLELAKSLGIAREKIICVGDAVNDIGMIKAAVAAWPYLMRRMKLKILQTKL